MLRKFKQLVQEFPFSSNMKRMSMVCQGADKEVQDLYTKGAEVVLTICDNVMDPTGDLQGITGDEDSMKLVAATQEKMAKQGLRV